MSTFVFPTIIKKYFELDQLFDILKNAPQLVKFEDSTYTDPNGGCYANVNIINNGRSYPLIIRFVDKKLATNIYKSAEEQMKNMKTVDPKNKPSDKCIINLVTENGSKEEFIFLTLEALFKEYLSKRTDMKFQIMNINGKDTIIPPQISTKVIHKVYKSIAPRVGPFELKYENGIIKKVDGFSYKGAQIQHIMEVAIDKKIRDKKNDLSLTDHGNYMKKLEELRKVTYPCASVNKMIPVGSMIRALVVRFQVRYAKTSANFKGTVTSLVYEPSFGGDTEVTDDLNVDGYDLGTTMMETPKIEGTPPVLAPKIEIPVLVVPKIELPIGAPKVPEPQLK